MKLEPIAKPIRIRIKLGKSEFSSLDSVKNNFVIKELYPLFLDGRLDRWLTQIGETTLAKEVKEMSTKCTEDSLRDYILFLSLFFEEIASSVSLNGHKTEDWSPEQYLSNAPISTWEFVYEKTKEIANIDWKHCLEQALSKNNIDIINLFQSKSLYNFFDAVEWGANFAKNINSSEEYKYFANFLEKKLRVNSDLEPVFLEYFHATELKGYKWADSFKDASLSVLLHWYSIRAFRREFEIDWPTLIRPLLTFETAKDLYQSPDYSTIFDEDWGVILADLIQNWESENDSIEELLVKNFQHLNAYYQRCVERGFKGVEHKLDSWYMHLKSPWYILSKSKDYPLVLKEIKSWDINSYHQSKNEYSLLETSLAKSIIDFLHLLAGVYHSGRLSKFSGDIETLRKSYFSDEVEIMIAIKENSSSWGIELLDKEAPKRIRERIERIANTKGNALANYVLQENEYSYYKVATYFVKSILLPKVRSLQVKA